MAEHKERRERRSYTAEFKQQVVDLYFNGKKRSAILAEYDLSDSLFDKWKRQAENTGSFKEADNRTEEEERLLQLEKENKQLRMENDILKQAALIMGRK